MKFHSDLLSQQDDSGWTPFMIAASIKDGDKVADILLSRGADVNQTSMCSLTIAYSMLARPEAN